MKFGFIKYLRKKADVLSVFKNSVIAGQVAQKTRPEDLEEKAICFDPESQVNTGESVVVATVVD